MRDATDVGRRARLSMALLLALGTLASTGGCAKNADDFYAQGARALAAGHLSAASEAFHRAIEQDPGRGDAYLALGKIYLEQEKWSPAANALREASRLDKRRKSEAERLLIDALYQDALHKLRMGKQRAAIVAFRELFEKAPDYPKLREAFAGALLRYGREAILRHDYIEGVEALKEVLRVDPGNASARGLLDRIRFSAK